LVLLTVFLVLRTFLSIYLAGVNGKIVKAIIEKDAKLFIKRVCHSFKPYRYSDLV
jgi:ATP-binding cassette subfamily D (ALD) protein 3